MASQARPLDVPSDPPARSRRERKKERTRHEIFGAAMRLYAECGVEGVTVEQICEAADVARGTFFAHFPTKAALLFEFNRTMTALFRGDLQEPRGSAVSELEALVDRLAEAWLQRADVMSAMLREFLAAPPSPDQVEVESQFLPALIEDIVRRGQERGEFRRTLSPRLAAAVFLSTSLAILSGRVFAEGEVEPGEVRDQFLEAVLHGLVAPDSSNARLDESDPSARLDERNPG
jgi:AcrR family transcriptional regulator